MPSFWQKLHFAITFTEKNKKEHYKTQNLGMICFLFGEIAI